jgi:hypothetical protein
MPVILLAVVGAVVASALTLTPFITSLALAAPTGGIHFSSRQDS